MEELVTLVAFREQLLACLLAIDQVTDALERNPLQNENATVWSQRLGAAAQTIHELHEAVTLDISRIYHALAAQLAHAQNAASHSA
jgi:hypothetical protein